jgi:hypothetical protein
VITLPFDLDACAVVVSAESFAVAATSRSRPTGQFDVVTFKDWNSITGETGRVDVGFSVVVFC